eukprot:gene6022-7352_t
MVVLVVVLVYPNGDICLDILQNRWSSTYNVAGILASIQSLLDNPNPDSPANNEAASSLTVIGAAFERLYSEDEMIYERKVRACVEQSWIDDPSKLPH